VTTFQLSASDPAPGTGILPGYPKYSHDDVSYSSYYSRFRVSGSSALYYYARDGADNEELPHNQYLYTIDDTAPAIDITLTCSSEGARYNGWYNILSGAPLVTISTTETGSGTASTSYDTAGGVPTTDYSVPFSLSTAHIRL